MKVCAIVLDFRGAERIARCLRSLVDEDLTTIYLVDNNSVAAESAKLAEVRRRAGAGLDTHACIVDVKSGDNLGFARGVNLAIRRDLASQAPHEAYLLINSDALLPQGVLRQLIETLQADRQLALVAPAECVGGARRGFFWYNRWTGALTRRWWPASFPYLSGCCLLVRRTGLLEGKLLDEDFFMYGEDVELGWRMRREGHSIRCLEELCVYHEGSATARNGSFFYEYHLNHSHLLLTFKLRANMLELPFLLVTKLCSLLLRSLWRALRFRSLVPVAALFVALLPINIRPPSMPN